MTISVMLPVLIYTDKQLGMTIQCIEKMRTKTKLPFELVIVETNTEYLMSEYADVHIMDKKDSCTKSCNRGFEACTGDYVCFMSNDVYVDDNWLECLCDCFAKKEDCGIATLATTQFNHEKHDEISEGVWFSVALFPKQDKYFDENYVNSWDDTDFIMRTYLGGKKMYRNFNCVVDHLVGQTHYASPSHYDNFRKNGDLFKSKYKYCMHPMYEKLISGVVI